MYLLLTLCLSCVPGLVAPVQDQDKTTPATLAYAGVKLEYPQGWKIHKPTEPVDKTVSVDVYVPHEELEGNNAFLLRVESKHFEQGSAPVLRALSKTVEESILEGLKNGMEDFKMIKQYRIDLAGQSAFVVDYTAKNSSGVDVRGRLIYAVYDQPDRIITINCACDQSLWDQYVEEADAIIKSVTLLKPDAEEGGNGDDDVKDAEE